MIHVWSWRGSVCVQWGEKGVIHILHPDGTTEERLSLPSDATRITEECSCEF